MWPCRAQEGEDARLYTAVKALSDFCCELQINVPTGKDSLSMTQKYPNGEKIISPGTVIVTSGGQVSDIKKVVSPVVQNVPSTLYHIDFSFDELRLGGSAFAQVHYKVGSDVPTVKNSEYFRDCFNAIQTLIQKGLILAGHDISAGGLITTLLEMTFANTKGGLNINLDKIKTDDLTKILFAENPGVVIQVANGNRSEVKKFLEDEGVGYINIGEPVEGRALAIQKNGQTYDFDIDAVFLAKRVSDFDQRIGVRRIDDQVTAADSRFFSRFFGWLFFFFWFFNWFFSWLFFWFVFWFFDFFWFFIRNDNNWFTWNV
jgi:phosphoribosylformylglycinamidine synthase